MQLYIEGATYVDSIESWALAGAGGLRLWAIGKNDLYNVTLLVSYDTLANDPPPNFILTPTRIGDAPVSPDIITQPLSDFPGITDPFAPIAPTLTTFNSAAIPNPGGVWGPGRTVIALNLGHFTTPESRAFNATDPPFDLGTTTLNTQVNVYDITFAPSAQPGQVVNFGLYGCTVSGTECVDSGGRYKFAPFSHDAQWLQDEPDDVPAPGALALVGLGLLGLGALNRRRVRA